MKIRNGFVSNSSSSSFIVQKATLTELQKTIIRGYDDILKAILKNDYDNGWDMVEEDDYFSFYTSMDNMDLASRLCDLGIPRDAMGAGERDDY